MIVPKEENETAAANETDATNATVDATNATVDSDAEKKEDKKDDAKEVAGETKGNETEAKNATNQTKPARKPKKKVHRRELTFKYIAPNNEGTVLAMSEEDKKEAMKRLKALQEADDERRLRDSLKNTLESYVFSTRSKIREHEEDLEKVSTDEEREKIMEDLEGIEDWLYEDGEEGGANAPIDAYKEKQKKMDERVNALFFRHAELEERPKSVETAR